jgi:hypothetical protein
MGVPYAALATTSANAAANASKRYSAGARRPPASPRSRLADLAKVQAVFTFAILAYKLLGTTA